MEEDDLLGGDLRHEKDLRRQLQRGPRAQGEGDRGDSKEEGLRAMASEADSKERGN